MEDKIKKLNEKIQYLEWKIMCQEKEIEEKPNVFQWFTLGFSISTILSVLFK